MRTWMRRLCPSGWALRKLGMLVVLAGVGVAGFCWGRQGAVPPADAQVPDLFRAGLQQVSAPAAVGTSDYGRRVVAYLYKHQPVTREELGEYLIARFGAERLDFLVNRRIVEMKGAELGQSVSDAEVDAQLREDLRGFNNMTEQDFASQILKRFNKTLFEWREDVIRPKLLMAKLVRPTVQVLEKDVQEAFEAKYGPKVQCRMIVMPATPQFTERHAIDTWEKVRGGRAAFLAHAQSQAIPALAAKQGEVPPIHRHFGDAKLEGAAFSLKEGEISALLQMKDGSHVILLCEKHLPADASKRLENERMVLSREIYEMKVAQAIPVAFQQMRQQANPQLLLTKDTAQVPSAAPARSSPVSLLDPAPPAAPTATASAIPPPPAPTAVPPPPAPARGPSAN